MTLSRLHQFFNRTNIKIRQLSTNTTQLSFKPTDTKNLGYFTLYAAIRQIYKSTPDKVLARKQAENYLIYLSREDKCINFSQPQENDEYTQLNNTLTR